MIKIWRIQNKCIADNKTQIETENKAREDPNNTPDIDDLFLY